MSLQLQINLEKEGDITHNLDRIWHDPHPFFPWSLGNRNLGLQIVKNVNAHLAPLVE